MSELQTASVYSGWDEVRNEGKQSLESISDNNNNKKKWKKILSQILTCGDVFTN